MASRIAGITVEIGGDTTKLQTALKGVNSQIKDTTSQLRDVDRLLKIDPGNTELLMQKQRMLTSAIAETKEKLETLKMAAESADQALANGTMSQNQYDALQREIIETEQALKSLEAQAERSGVAVQKIAAKGENLKSIGNNMVSAGRSMSMVSAGVAAVGTAAVKTTMDFEQSMSKVKSLLHGTSSDMEILEAKAREMGAATKFTATECADAMSYMALAGWDTTEVVDGLQGVLYLAADSEMDLGRASDIVTDNLSAFGLTAKDTNRFVDQMAYAMSNSNTETDQLAEAFKNVAATSTQLGYSLEDTTAALMVMADGGIKGGEAGTALASIMTRLGNNVSNCRDMLESYGIEVYDSKGNVKELSSILGGMKGVWATLTDEQKANLSYVVAGKTAQAELMTVLGETTGSFEEYASGLRDCDGAAEEMYNTMTDNLAGSIDQLKSKLGELGLAFGKELLPSIKGLVQFLGKLVDHLNGMDEGTRKVIVVVSLLVAAIGPVLLITGKLLVFVGQVMTFAPQAVALIGSATRAIGLLNGVLLANPIAIVIAAVAALIVIFALLWNNCEGFRNFWIGLWEDLKSFATGAGSAIGEGLKAVSEHFNHLKTEAGAKIRELKSDVTEGFSQMKAAASGRASEITTSVVGAFTQIKSKVKGIVSEAYSWGYDLVMGIVKGIQASISKLSGAVNSVANTIRAKLHFSVPDEGPLTDYESWMPDFISGLADGLERSRGVLSKAIDHVAEDMVLPIGQGGMVSVASGVPSGKGIGGEVAEAIKESLGDGLKAQGDICIPVYIGSNLIDEVVVNAQNRQNLRSGGR